jgi:hypothetical protein
MMPSLQKEQGVAVVECPNCRRRLRAPEGFTNASLRCPVCRHIFRQDGNGQPAQPASVADEEPLGAAGQQEPGSEQVGELTAKMLSQADEALLREYGAGSGLLELTREAYEVSGLTGREERKNAVEVLLAGMAAQQAENPAPAALQGGHQFQVVTTALTLANRLVLTYKFELTRARRLLLVAWVAVVVLTLLGVVALWYGTSQSGEAEREKLRSSMLTQEQARMTQDYERMAQEQTRLSAESQGVRNARDAVLDSQATIHEQSTRILQLMAELDKYRGATRPASQPADR